MIRLSVAFAALAAATLATVLLVVVPGAGGADCTSTASNASALSSALGSANSGATLCLADGSYGRLTLNASKSAPGVTVQAQHPGKATIDGATRQTIAPFSNSARPS